MTGDFRPMKSSQAPLESLNQFLDKRRKELKEATKQMKFWERETTVLGVQLDKARENFRFFEKKVALLEGSIATCSLIAKGDKNGQ